MDGNSCRLPGSVVRAPTKQRGRSNMPTFIKMAVRLEKPARRFSDDFLAVAMFSGIGLLLTLVAVNCGVQGVWF
jgi:hypothetical protein